MATMKGIEIVGGGLAGLSLGVALRKRQVPVRVREAGSYPRHRVCGEFINGVTGETLETLGVAGIFREALLHRATRWWMGERKILEAELNRPALGMSRWEMDQRLGREFENCGGILVTRSRAKPEPREGLVWTAGRHLEKASGLLGLKGHFEGIDLEGFLEMHIGEGGYVGLTPVTADGSRVNVCGLFQRGPRDRRVNPLIDALRQSGLTRLAERLEEATMDPKSLTGISGLALGQQAAPTELLTLGDAERMIPPFTGNGMSMAFEAAECAVEPLADYAAGELAWSATREKVEVALRERFQTRIKLALILHQALTRAAGRAALTAAAVSGVLPFAWLHRRLS
jgi:flavin-dependent dehydrogenase